MLHTGKSAKICRSGSVERTAGVHRIGAEVVALPKFARVHATRRSARSAPRPNLKGIDAGCGECRRSPQREALLRRCCPGHRNLRVLFGSHTRHADGTDNLAFDDDWHTTF
jgi:hypothetical protein